MRPEHGGSTPPSRKFPRAVIVLGMIACSSAAAWGQGRTDVVTLINGDRITGEILELDRGRLELKTDNAGTIEIEWDKIARIEATRQFDVVTSDGRRFLGSLGRTGDGFLLIVGGETVTSADTRGDGHLAHRRDLLGEARGLPRRGIQLHAFERCRVRPRSTRTPRFDGRPSPSSSPRPPS